MVVAPWLLEAAPVADPTWWAWVKLVGALLLAPGTIAFGFAAWAAWKRGELLQFFYATLETHKVDAAGSGSAEVVKRLTTAIGNGLALRPDLTAEHGRQLSAAGVNLAAILGPAIADSSRRAGDPHAGSPGA